MKVTMLGYPVESDWIAVKQRAIVTIGKTKVVNAPDEKWKRAILMARHSPIRYLRFSFLMEDIPYWVSVHLCRHVHAQPYVRSQRNDRQDQYDRNAARQDAPVTMIFDVNAEELITIANKRLCGQTAAETRELVKMMCAEVVSRCPEFQTELVPQCVRNNGKCFEMFPCGKEGISPMVRRMME